MGVAADERRALSALFDELGPDAPTLCEGWTNGIAYHEIPAAELAAWHRCAAEALADTGTGVEHVARQLVAVPASVDDWVIGWLAEHHVALAARAPSVAALLLRRVLEECGPADPRREVLLVANVRVLFALDQEPLDAAREALALTRDPERAAEMRHIAAVLAHRRGDTRAAVAFLEGHDAPGTPSVWLERRRSLLANLGRGRLDDLGRAARQARRSHRAALSAGEPYPIGHALQTLWLIKSIERDHEAALGYVERALKVVEGRPEQAELYFDLLDQQVFTLGNLDRLPEADTTLRAAQRAGAHFPRPPGLQLSAAIHDYWTGAWDEALAQLESLGEDGLARTVHGMREPGQAALLRHGIAGVIHGRRGDTERAAAHVHAAEETAPLTHGERAAGDFLLVARSLRAEQQGDPQRAVDILTPLTRTGHAPMVLRHQWLPRLVRLAREHGRDDVVTEALAMCREEAAKEVLPARAASAARWCEALATDDPEPLLRTIARYGEVGRPVERATALGDAAVLLAAAGRPADAREAADEAIGGLAALGADWDVYRIGVRLREFGIDAAESDPAARWPFSL